MLPRNHPDRIRVSFDDHRLVANAGLLLPATLAQHLGLPEASLCCRARAYCNKASCGCNCTVRPVPGAAATHWGRSGHTPQTAPSNWKAFTL